VNAFNPSKTNFAPSQSTDSTCSQNPKPAIWQSTTALSQSEIESLRLEAKQADEQIAAYLDILLAETA
jgi:hypothetical protein